MQPYEDPHNKHPNDEASQVRIVNAQQKINMDQNQKCVNDNQEDYGRSVVQFSNWNQKIQIGLTSLSSKQTSNQSQICRRPEQVPR